MQTMRSLSSNKALKGAASGDNVTLFVFLIFCGKVYVPLIKKAMF